LQDRKVYKGLVHWALSQTAALNNMVGLLADTFFRHLNTFY
jgi:hypothetical protein